MSHPDLERATRVTLEGPSEHARRVVRSRPEADSRVGGDSFSVSGADYGLTFVEELERRATVDAREVRSETHLGTRGE